MVTPLNEIIKEITRGQLSTFGNRVVLKEELR